MPEVYDALVTFFESWVESGLGADGLPLYKEVVMVRLAKPPLTEVEYVATDEHLSHPQFREAYEVFSKQRKGRDLTVEGYPLSMWPVVSPAELHMLLARDIVTVEQLAALALKKGDDVIPEIRELAQRAKKLIELQGKTGKFEAIITDLTQQRDAIVDQLKEANATISAQNSMIAMLQSQAAPRQQVA